MPPGGRNKPLSTTVRESPLSTFTFLRAVMRQVSPAYLLAGFGIVFSLQACASANAVTATPATDNRVGSCVAAVLDYGGDGEGEPELKRTKFTYDASGRVVIGGLAPVVYDASGRVKRVGSSTWARDTDGYSLVVDRGDNEFTRRQTSPDGGFREVNGPEDPYHERKVTLDTQGRVAEVYWSGFSHAMKGRFTYDGEGRAAEVKYYDQPSGDLMAVFTFRYGKRGELRITESSSSLMDDDASSIIDITVKFDADGRMLSWHQVSRETGKEQSVRKYVYDGRGNLLSLTLHRPEDPSDVLFSATYSGTVSNIWCGRQKTRAWPVKGPHWWHASTIKQALMTESPYEWLEHPLGWGRMD